MGLGFRASDGHFFTPGVPYMLNAAKESDRLGPVIVWVHNPTLKVDDLNPAVP